jgi:hypothetical protein
LGNSNVQIAKMFVELLRSVYKIDNKKFRCYLHLRADQNASDEITFWSSSLGISETLFGKSQFDKRTTGKKTFLNYHGVCSVYYYDASVEKRLTAVQKIVIDKILGV